MFIPSTSELLRRRGPWTDRGRRWYNEEVASLTGWISPGARFLLGQVLILIIIRLSSCGATERRRRRSSGRHLSGLIISARWLRRLARRVSPSAPLTAGRGCVADHQGDESRLVPRHDVRLPGGLPRLGDVGVRRGRPVPPPRPRGGHRPRCRRCRVHRASARGSHRSARSGGLTRRPGARS